jgi:hypothetical protein
VWSLVAVSIAYDFYLLRLSFVALLLGDGDSDDIDKKGLYFEGAAK